MTSSEEFHDGQNNPLNTEDMRSTDQNQAQRSLVIQASWHRAMLLGLDMHRAPSAVPQASSTQLSMLLHARQHLMSYACPEMRRLGQRMRKFDGLLMLADPCGIVLCTMGDNSFAQTAARVALRAGANWLERWRGTNAIGTVIATGRPVVVEGMEHYISSNGFLTCAAAPIHDVNGQLTGVLNVSNRHGKLSADTLGLVSSSAANIEKSIFLNFFSRQRIFILRKQGDDPRSPFDGLLALSEDNVIVGADMNARRLITLRENDFGRMHLKDILGFEQMPFEFTAPSVFLPARSERSAADDNLQGLLRWGMWHIPSRDMRKLDSNTHRHQGGIEPMSLVLT